MTNEFDVVPNAKVSAALFFNVEVGLVNVVVGAAEKSKVPLTVTDEAFPKAAELPSRNVPAVTATEPAKLVFAPERVKVEDALFCVIEVTLAPIAPLTTVPPKPPVPELVMEPT